MLEHFRRYLTRAKVPQAAAAEIAELGTILGDLVARVNALSGAILVYEAVLEHHKLLSPEIMETVKPLVVAKLTAGQAGAPLSAA